MKSIAIFGAVALVASSASAQTSHSSWRGYSVTRVINSAGNTQYRVFANYAVSNITYLNAFDHGKVSASQPAQYGTMNAIHTGLGEFSWIPQGTASASHVSNDSWVTSTGTHVGSQTALDPSFIETDADGNPIASALAQPPLHAGWYDATPGTANSVGAGSQGGHDGQNAVGGYQILLMQIIRQGDDSTNGLGKARFNLTSGFKIANTTTALFGFGSYVIGVPAPGAVALLALAGLAARRRRG
jgi:hypothetical protein